MSSNPESVELGTYTIDLFKKDRCCENACGADQPAF